MKKFCKWVESHYSYALSTKLYFRGLGLIYLVAFGILYNQGLPLLGSQGILPIANFHLKLQHLGFWELPSLYHYWNSDSFLQFTWVLGIILSLIVMFIGQNGFILAILWVLHLSITKSGQAFYGFGWELMLVEAGFLSIFLTSFWRFQFSFLPERKPPFPPVLLLQWMLFRLMLGAGLIKLRGDSCWRELTCLNYHFETQPNPHPLSYFWHSLPPFLLKFGVLINHFVEIVVPWFIFSPRKFRYCAGLILMIFQIFLILSGNLSWLNWFTLFLCFFCFDDEFYKKFRYGDMISMQKGSKAIKNFSLFILLPLFLWLSLAPIQNLFSSRQAMNRTHDPLGLVNSYGMFGGIGQKRLEVILEGTQSQKPNERAEWKEYVFPCKPGPLKRRPCFITPYHYRLDWQLWFLQFGDHRRNPWIGRVIKKLLEGSPEVLELVEENPFEGVPSYIRASIYEYRFSKTPGIWWERKYLGPYLPPLGPRNFTNN